MKVNYPETILTKSQGFTPAEEYLANLCNQTFLSLWSYPNVFRDQGRISSESAGTKGDGKEVCDLLVVFDNHLIVFSDKHCTFPQTGDIQVDWSRWYRKAIKEAANQIYGAERWILKYPDRLFLDRKCAQSFPLTIPPREMSSVHRIIVAHGVSKECIKCFGGTGSLLLNPGIIGDMHMATPESRCNPFVIGQVNPQKGYIHVFDDTTLETVMKTLDTISDFIRYLTKKEKLISSEKLIAAAGEDDLLAFYLMQIDDAGEHTFFPNSKTQPDGIVIDQGFWDTFQKHPSRIAQIRANRISYSWNMLIEKFIFHITTGTSYKMSHPSLKTQEGLFRLLAKEDRTRRRMLAESLHDLLARTPKDYRATRLLLPSHVGEPHYLFLLLPKPENESYEEYRRIRGELLSCYLRITKVKRPEVKDIIGFATEPGTSKNRSEDIMYFDASNWTDQDEKETRRIEKEFVQCGLFGKRSMFMDTFKEYPDRQTRPIKISMKGDERNKPCPCGSGKKFKKCCGA